MLELFLGCVGVNSVESNGFLIVGVELSCEFVVFESVSLFCDGVFAEFIEAAVFDSEGYEGGCFPPLLEDRMEFYAQKGGGAFVIYFGEEGVEGELAEGALE